MKILLVIFLKLWYTISMENLNVIKTDSKKKAIIKFCNIVLGSIGAFILTFSIVALAFFMPEHSSAGPNITIDSIDFGGSRNTLPLMNIGIDRLPIKTSFVLYGLDDEGYGADLVMIAVFDRIQNSIDVISIPRDTLITINGRHAIIRDHVAFPGRERGSIVVTEHLEELFGIDIDYYLAVDLDAFQQLVNLVGPIPFDVPHRMRYHNGLPPGHPNLLIIDLQPGLQYLNGEQAEWVMRYRGTYRMGDLQRIENQQAFTVAFMDYVLNSETLVRNAFDIIRLALDAVQTDFDNPLPFIPYLSNINIENLTMHTLPTFPNAANPNRLDINMTESRRLISYVFFDIPMNPPEEDSEYTLEDLTEAATNSANFGG